MARNRSRRPSDRNRAAARPHGLHVTRKYARVNRRRRVTVRGRTTVSKASHRTAAITRTLSRNASRCTGGGFITKRLRDETFTEDTSRRLETIRVLLAHRPDRPRRAGTGEG